jgi:hypothetical protein
MVWQHQIDWTVGYKLTGRKKDVSSWSTFYSLNTTEGGSWKTPESDKLLYVNTFSRRRIGGVDIKLHVLGTGWMWSALLIVLSLSLPSPPLHS